MPKQSHQIIGITSQCASIGDRSKRIAADKLPNDPVIFRHDRRFIFTHAANALVISTRRNLQAAPLIKHHHAVSNGEGTVHFMRHYHAGHAKLLGERQNQLINLRARHRIKTSTWFVIENDFRIKCQRACQASALLHAAGNLRREFVSVFA